MPRRVDDGDFDLGTLVGHIAEDFVEAEAVTSNVALVPNLCVYWNEIALPAGLDSEPAEENQGSRGRFDFAIKPVERRLHRLLGEVFADIDVKTLVAQLRAEGAGVADRLRQRRVRSGIGRIADEERDAAARRSRRHRGSREEKNHEGETEPQSHGTRRAIMCCSISYLKIEQSGSQQLQVNKTRPRRGGKAQRVAGGP